MDAAAPLATLSSPALQGLPTAAQPSINLHPGNAAKMWRTAQGFESMFLNQMFEVMNESVQADPNFGGGQAENIIRSMLSEQYGKQVTRHGGVGIASAVYQEMVRLQEGGR
jgi:Rod binding domain-containing protein